MKRLAVVRMKGEKHINQKVDDTLKMLNLTKVNYCTIINDDKVYSGMLQKVKDLVTWGEVGKDSVNDLLKNRGELVGRKKITDSYIKKRTSFKSISDFSKAFVDFKAELKDIPEIRPVFRLHPPRKGHEGIKRTYRQGGALGQRDNIEDLLIKMR